MVHKRHPCGLQSPVMFLDDSYTQAPGQCRICGTPTVPTVNTLVDLDEHSAELQRLYVCHHCVETMVGLVGGWVRADELDAAEKRAAAAESETERARKVELAAISGLDNFVKAGKFEVTADLYDQLTPEAQDRVNVRLAKKVTDKINRLRVPA